MTIITRYKCDICGTEYTREYGALQCEASKPPRPPYEPGDSIVIESYGGPKKHIVKNILMKGSARASYGSTYNEKELREADKLYKSDLKSSMEWHIWVIQIAKQEHISRDEWSDIIGMHLVLI